MDGEWERKEVGYWMAGRLQVASSSQCYSVNHVVQWVLQLHAHVMVWPSEH